MLTAKDDPTPRTSEVTNGAAGGVGGTAPLEAAGDLPSALQQTLAELDRVKGLLWQRELLLENTEQGIWHLDNVGLTVYVNPAMCRLLGRERSDIMGRGVFDFFAGPDLAILKDQLEKRKLGHKRGYEIGIKRPDGSRVECFNNATPIFDAAGGKLGSVGMWTDLTPLKQARREVDAALAESLVQRAEYEALLASFPGSIGVLDQDARYVFVNKALADLVGRPVHDIIGRPAHEIVGSERAALLIAEFQRLRAGEIIVDIKEAPPSDGLPGYVLRLNRVAGPPGADGRQLFYAFGIDISDMVKGEAKGAFLTHMSHEIRTPMNAIMGLTALALRTPLTLQQQDYLDKVQLAAHSLMGLLDDVLDLSKIESGKLQIETIGFSLDEVLEGTAAVLGILVEEKGLALKVSRQPEVPDQLIGDPLRLRQVLTNLIGNARKFTDHGSITVTTALASSQADQVVLRFAVADTGMGMSAEHQARLFQPFSQADESITRRFGGTGLGLAISRQLVELMGGRIGVASEPGQGSTFSFELPFRLAQPQDLPVRAGKTAGGGYGLAGPGSGALASIRGARILLVEDNAINQQVAVELLTQAGFHVAVAGDGLQGLARLGESEGRPDGEPDGEPDGGFDCVLMDLQMPVMDGYAAAARIRANPAWAALPVLAMSADVMSEDRERAAHAGMNAHIAKPIQPQELFAALLKWIPPGERKPPADAVAKPAAGGVLVPDIPGIELPQVLIDAAAQNPGLLATLLGQFLHDHSNDGQTVHQALAAGDLQTAQRVAHTLKGVGGSIGALAMAQRAGELELALREGRHGALSALAEALEAALAPLMAGLRPWAEDGAAIADLAPLLAGPLQADGRPRILIVDDERFNLNLLESLLRDDYQVVAAINGHQALQAASTHSPDLVLLDINMPGIDGYEVCRRLKADPLTRGIPVVFISALDEASHETQGLELGAADFITKPFRQSAVRARLRTQLRLKQQRELLERYAFRDSLTGLTNRRAFDAQAEKEWFRCWRGGLPLSVIMIDVDHFKRYNDSHGHAAGDVCLQRVALTLEKSIKRAGDLVARYGGEEFIVLLPGAAAPGALVIGEALRMAVEVTGIEHQTSKVADTVTVSAGIATVTPAGPQGLAALLEAADQMLYAAKVQGRNRSLGITLQAT